MLSPNGDDHSFEITSNLHNALLQFREGGFKSFIWVDAICINQADLNERAMQVRIMRQIYGKAELVYIWLGSESADTAIGIELLHRTAQAVRGKYYATLYPCGSLSKWISAIISYGRKY